MKKRKTNRRRNQESKFPWKWVLLIGGAILLLGGMASGSGMISSASGLSDAIRDKILRVLATIESGGIRYDIIYIRPGGVELAYGLLQTTLTSGGLENLLNMYIQSGGSYASQLQPYMGRVASKDTSLEKDTGFLDLLKAAGREDSVMAKVQNQYFQQYYLEPAFLWAKEKGFTLPVAYLAIADTFVHSGSQAPFGWAGISSFPIDGQDEKAVLTQYLEWRIGWLQGKGGVLAATSFRPQEWIRLLSSDPNLEGSVMVRNTEIT